MPYISRNDDRRKALRKSEPALTAGELNYQIFYFIKHSSYDVTSQEIILKEFVKQFLGDNPNYQKYNDMTGVLIRCYKEIKRRLGFKVNLLLEILDEYDTIIDKYEDLKIVENGDVE